MTTPGIDPGSPPAPGLMDFSGRVQAVLQGRKPDRLPFISRMDFWHRGLVYQGCVPTAYRGMSLSEVHRAIGFAQEDWLSPGAHKYRGLELISARDGQEILHMFEPEIAFFPDLWGLLPADRPGEMTTELVTPVGRLVYQHRLTDESLRAGTTRPQLVARPVRSPEDVKIYAYLLEHAEFVPRFDEFRRREKELAGLGYLVPTLNRVPFQSLLIDVLGELPLFYALHDTPAVVERLLEAVDRQTVEMLENLSGLDVPYVEFIDNLEGAMTNPRLYQKYLVPCYQRYASILHRQGKTLGSHTDGNLQPLLHLLPESGLDVCESFTPAPITECTFEAAWSAWEKGPLIWGGIPSYYLEPRQPEAGFRRRIESLLALVRDRPIILGVADAVMSDCDIERVRWIARRVEELEL
jgi:hypothetical protein